MPLSRYQLSKAKWQVAFEYTEGSTNFKVFKADGVDGITITHQWTDGGRVKIGYRAAGRSFDSPSEACRHFNQEEARARGGGQGTPGSVEQIAARKGAGG